MGGCRCGGWPACLLRVLTVWVVQGQAKKGGGYADRLAGAWQGGLPVFATLTALKASI